MAGRTPTPDYLKLVTGNPGRRPLDAEPAAPGTFPQPTRPEFLDEVALAHWDRTVPLLAQHGFVDARHQVVLEKLCSAYSRWRFAELKIRQLSDKQAASGDDAGGLVTKTHNGFEQFSQWLNISNKMHELLKACEVELGLTPAAQARVKAMANQGSLFPESDPLGAFLKAGRPAA